MHFPLGFRQDNVCLVSLSYKTVFSSKSRFEVVDMLVKKWLLRYGGDPSHYKKQTRAFDALAALADRLIRKHVRILIGPQLSLNYVTCIWRFFDTLTSLGESYSKSGSIVCYLGVMCDFSVLRWKLWKVRPITPSK